jgi:hypothetical protein
MDDIKRTPFESIKTVNGITLSVRRRFERFNTPYEEYEDVLDIDFQLLPWNKSAHLYLKVCDPVEDEGVCWWCSSLHVDQPLDNYTCKLWLENLNGEKCPEINCKYYLIYSIFYLI